MSLCITRASLHYTSMNTCSSDDGRSCVCGCFMYQRNRRALCNIEESLMWSKIQTSLCYSSQRGTAALRAQTILQTPGGENKKGLLEVSVHTFGGERGGERPLRTRCRINTAAAEQRRPQMLNEQDYFCLKVKSFKFFKYVWKLIMICVQPTVEVLCAVVERI